MKEANPSSPPNDSSVPAQPANISPGMAALLRRETEPPTTGDSIQQKQSSQNDKPAPKQNRAVLKTSLVIADVLLVLLAACLALRKSSFGFLEITLCVIALAVGAWLACLAVSFNNDNDC